MCDIAPLWMRCVNEEYQHNLLCCKAAHLGCAMQELKRSMPIIGNMFGPYKCQMFVPETDLRKEKK